MRFSTALLLATMAFCGCAVRTPRHFRFQGSVLYPPNGTKRTATLRYSSTAARTERGKECGLTSSSLRLRWRGNTAEIRLRPGGRDLFSAVDSLRQRFETGSCLAPGESLDLVAQILENAPAVNGVLVPLMHVADGYTDLKSGIRLRMLSPILPDNADGLRIETTTSPDGEIRMMSNLLGYETAWYELVHDAQGRGLTLALDRVEDTIGSAKSLRAAPRKDYLNRVQPGYLRLLLLTRLSKADHNILLVAAPSRVLLEQISARFASEPYAPVGGLTAAVIPPEVALAAMMRVQVNGQELDVPVGSTVAEVIQSYDSEHSQDLPKTLAIWRPYHGQLTPVQFDPRDQTILRLALVGGEKLTW